MGNLALLELWLEELANGKPLLVKHPTIYVVMQDFHLAIVLGIKDKSLIVIPWIMINHLAHY